jgi:hypothetical protein
VLFSGRFRLHGVALRDQFFLGSEDTPQQLAWRPYADRPDETDGD